MTVQASVKQPALSSEEIEFYNKYGFVIPKFHLSEDDVEELHNGLNKVIAKKSNFDGQPISVNYCNSDSNGGISDGLDTVRKFAAHSELLDAVEQLLGPDIIGWSTVVFHRPPKGQIATPWHQDADYPPIRPMKTVSAWIALTDVTVESGCMRMIPESHRNEIILPHGDPTGEGGFNFQIDPAAIDESTAVDIELKPGHMVLFDIHTIHGSRPNLGRTARTNLVARYMPATSRFNHEYQTSAGTDYSKTSLVVLRGADRAGNRTVKI